MTPLRVNILISGVITFLIHVISVVTLLISITGFSLVQIPAAAQRLRFGGHVRMGKWTPSYWRPRDLL